ncbi:MAG: hypothetical protein KDA44_20850, partial [Planctomycetales bacterium]|nr:hypothetical protein [Planctomycetales bacterium]
MLTDIDYDCWESSSQRSRPPGQENCKVLFPWFPTAKCAKKEPRRHNEHDGKSRVLVVVPVVP